MNALGWVLVVWAFILIPLACLIGRFLAGPKNGPRK